MKMRTFFITYYSIFFIGLIAWYFYYSYTHPPLYAHTTDTIDGFSMGGGVYAGDVLILCLFFSLGIVFIYQTIHLLWLIIKQYFN